MSVNLLAEFQEFYQPSAQSSVQPQPPPPIRSQSVKLDSTQDDPDDDFGEFESATPAAPAVAPVTPTLPSHQDPRSPVSPQDKPLPARPKPDLPVEKPLPKPRNLDVLFDAEDDDENDDFGDFEEAFSPRVATPVAEQPSLPATKPDIVQAKQESLIDFDDETPQNSSQIPNSAPPKPRSLNVVKPKPTPSARPSAPTSNGLGDLLGLDSPVQPELKAEPQPSQPTEPEEEAEWDDFETAETPLSSPQPAFTQQTPTLKPLGLGQLLSPSLPQSNELPPTNIPPPAILLTIFPGIVSQMQADLFTPLSQYNDDTETREAVLQLPQTQRYLSDAIECSIVLARIIAGRKNRWKRDKILAQSMSIGQAGRSGGMKLAGVDKAENAREERELADAVASWQTQLGKLKTAVKSAGVSSTVPDIAESYTVRLAPASEGAINSPKACIICGLKRNERVAKVDVQVQDSFGEWWREHFGHNQCIRLWYAQEDTLKSR